MIERTLRWCSSPAPDAASRPRYAGRNGVAFYVSEGAGYVSGTFLPITGAAR